MTRVSGNVYLVGLYSDEWDIEDAQVIAEVTSETSEREPYSYGWSRGAETTHTVEIVAVRFPGGWVASGLACQLLGTDTIAAAERQLAEQVSDGTYENVDYVRRVPCVTAAPDQLENAA